MRPAGMSSDEDDDDFYDYGYADWKDKKEKKEIYRPEPKPIPVTQSVRVNRGLNDKYERDRALSMLHRAVEEGDMDTIEDLLNEGVPVDGSFPGEWTPLMKACSKGDRLIVEYLLQNKSNPNQHKELFTPVMACCIATFNDEHERAECLSLLFQYGANPNARDKHKSTALINASANGLLELVNLLLSTPNIDINAQDKEGWTALFHAISNNHKPIVERLLLAGADISLKECRHDMTAVDIAEAKNLKELSDILGLADSSPAEPVVYKKPDPLRDFLSELPDDLGNGGFSNDVKYILSGVGLVNLYNKLNKNFNLPDFLNATDKDLFDAGVKFAPTRRKILLRGIHKFHLQPWKKTSMHQIGQSGQFQLEDVIHIVSSIVKHLAIMHSSLRYLKKRISIASEENDQDIINSELIPTLVETHKEINQLKQILRRLINQINQIKIVGTVQADHVGPDDYKFQEKKSKFICPMLLCSVVIGGLFYFVKFKFR